MDNQCSDQMYGIDSQLGSLALYLSSITPSVLSGATKRTDCEMCEQARSLERNCRCTGRLPKHPTSSNSPALSPTQRLKLHLVIQRTCNLVQDLVRPCDTSSRTLFPLRCRPSCRFRAIHCTRHPCPCVRDVHKVPDSTNGNPSEITPCFLLQLPLQPQSSKRCQLARLSYALTMLPDFRQRLRAG